MVFFKNWPCATIMHMTKSTWWPIGFETLWHALSMFLFTQNQRMKLKKRLRRGNHHPSHFKKAPIVPLTMNLILSRMFAYNLSLFFFFFFSFLITLWILHLHLRWFDIHWRVLCSNGVEEPMEEPAAEPEPEPEPEPKVEDAKPEADEKVLEEMEEKAPSPAPVESPPNTQEAPKVMQAWLWCSFNKI